MYKNNNWVLLNKNKSGGLGYGSKKWTIKTITEEALKYKTRSEFKKKSVGAYNSAIKFRIMDEICLHMNTKKIIHWTKELAHKEALKYDNFADFFKYSIKTYRVAYKLGYLSEITSHMKKTERKVISYWTKERCYEEALKYSTRNDFRKKSGSAYERARKTKILDEICSHMKTKFK